MNRTKLINYSILSVILLLIAYLFGAGRSISPAYKDAQYLQILAMDLQASSTEMDRKTAMMMILAESMQSEVDEEFAEFFRDLLVFNCLVTESQVIEGYAANDYHMLLGALEQWYSRSAVLTFIQLDLYPQMLEPLVSQDEYQQVMTIRDKYLSKDGLDWSEEVLSQLPEKEQNYLHQIRRQGSDEGRMIVELLGTLRQTGVFPGPHSPGHHPMGDTHTSTSSENERL